jgi:hypothetical protein
LRDLGIGELVNQSKPRFIGDLGIKKKLRTIEGLRVLASKIS